MAAKDRVARKMLMLANCVSAIRRCKEILWLEPTRSGAKFAANLSKAVLCAVHLCCSGCLHHKIVIENGFRLTENSGAPMLAPISGQTSERGNFQTSILVLPDGSASAKDRVSHQCTMNDEVFSLRSASPSDSRHWTVRSPSISGWNTLAGDIDIYSQWKIFARDLARMNEDGCFPPGLTALEIRAAIAQRIPLPAEEVPSFFYSDQGTGFADLAPGMEVGLQKLLPAGKSISEQSERPPRMWAATYEVIPRQGGGVRLKLTRKIQRGPNGSSASEEKELLSLSQRFARTPVLRLFLEGVYGKGHVSNGILIGASTQSQLDALTDLIRQSDPAKCINFEGTVCTEFPLGALTLFSTVWVNGHRTSCLLGTSLADLLRSQSRPEQTIALESVHVFRRLNLDHYAEIDFPRTESGANELRLLPGDRIESHL